MNEENTCSRELQASIIDRALWLRRWVNSREGRLYLNWWQSLVAPDEGSELRSNFPHRKVRTVAAPTEGPGVEARVRLLQKFHAAEGYTLAPDQLTPEERTLVKQMTQEGLISGGSSEDNPFGAGVNETGHRFDRKSPMPDEVVRTFTKGYRSAIHGEIYYVTPELGDQAALRMIRRTSASLRPHELITPTGLMFLPQTDNLNFQRVSGYLGQDERVVAVGWNCVGDSVTLFWICDQLFNNRDCAASWDSGKLFWTTDEWSPEINKAEWSGVWDGAEILLPFHYWACTGEREYGPLFRPDQPGAPQLPNIDITAWRNENQTSTSSRFVLEEGGIDRYQSELWAMIAFACECIRMLGEEYKYVEAANPIRSQSRETQRKWIKAGINKNSDGINVYTLREGHLRREGKYLSRGPLETRHHRRAHWRSNKGQGGDLTCRHEFGPHPDDYNWRVCVPCGRIEHMVVEAEVGPEGAPWVSNNRIGVLRR